MSAYPPAPAGTRPARTWTLSRRLLIAVVGLLALVCMVIGVATNTLMQSSLYGQVDGQLANAAARAAAFASSAPGGSTGASDPIFAPGQGAGTLNARLLPSGVLLASGVLDPRTGERSDIVQRDVPALADLVPGGPPISARLSIGDYRLVARKDPITHGTLITGLPLTATNQTLDALRWTMVTVSVAGLSATALIGSLIIRRSLRPLERVSALASAVAALPLDAGEVTLAQRVDPADSVPGTEAGDVGHALNALLDNVESALEVRAASEERMRRFVADASHELRTPLAAIRGYSDLLAATEHFSVDGTRALSRVTEQSQRMGSMVENLLLLARLDEKHGFAPADVDLSELATEICADFTVTAPQDDWVLDVSAGPVIVHADASQMTRVITNLLANAHKHTDPGTRIELEVGRSLDEKYGLLTVTDNGAGIDAEFLPSVFERFTRADVARTGTEGTTGLGLPIVKAIVEAHAGTITVTSKPGRTEFAVRLPLSDSDEPSFPGTSQTVHSQRPPPP
ncbi:sensor histidine kinase [Paeniglutamicibacter cryotolerans]|uniref:histidine kinase n=1 Tax=Paeniglutamicibacter cryotolerans TaxID=670079 RepID=A0A839QG64_9MICC|nr:HAMP domain-containing sensor histidine kinase [Paeniglutamicibacter cryotolerans]MBB2995308.1 two-component system OmpR family sensor kinase [Paeniglutamicibacter cryotolerans]